MAILHEGDEPGVVTEITYEDLLGRVCRVANAMKELGVKKGDFVTLYMPMVPEAAIAMLACARLGAPHSVVFAGFSAEALRDRIVVSKRAGLALSRSCLYGCEDFIAKHAVHIYMYVCGGFRESSPLGRGSGTFFVSDARARSA